jgi:hypothetical protein
MRVWPIRSRSQTIVHLQFWSVDIGKIIADFETWSDEELLLLKLKNRQWPAFQIRLCYNQAEYFLLAYVSESQVVVQARLNWQCLRCPIPISAFIPSSSLNDSWWNFLSDYTSIHPSMKGPDSGIWNVYCVEMGKGLQKTRKWFDEHEYRNPKKDEKRRQRKTKKTARRKTVKMQNVAN